ncbi:amidoligase family protein [Kineococcus sp. LSe6-4]|uniref:Amidoligase family protein n=1 Tax=Kineococcus halophytocola TaxID=3234027 RepID=A0ABV4GVR6_9ACTN
MERGTVRGQGHRRAAAPGRGNPAGGPLNVLPRTGFEVELLAPRGASRLDLAVELARRCAGRVLWRFHVDTESSAAPGVRTFWHLTPAFDVLDGAGRLRCSLVDDTTIVADLDATAPPRPGWFRVLSDDPRLLRLVQRYADPEEGIGSVLAPVAEVFGAPVVEVGGVHRLDDVAGATIALAAPLPGERERPCELVTPPFTEDHGERLEELLGPARDLGFSVPLEAAVHVNLDAGPFRDVAVFRRLVELFAGREDLHRRFGTNPHCRRLGALPPDLVDLVGAEWAGWEPLRAAAARTAVTKYCDVDVTRVLGVRSGPDVLEVRLLPGSDDGVAIARQAAQLRGSLRSTR